MALTGRRNSTMTSLVIRRPSCFGVPPAAPPSGNAETVELEFQELKRRVLDGTIVRHLFRHREVMLATPRIAHISKPFLTALLLRLLSRGRCLFSDDRGAQVEVGLGRLALEGLRFAWTLVRIPALLAGLRLELRRLAWTRGRTGSMLTLHLERSPVYLRGDLVFGLEAGGSVGHVAGVLNNLGRFAGPPVFITSGPVATVRSDVETHVVEPGSDFCGFEELSNFHFGAVLARRAAEILAERPVSFVYQRYCFGSTAGLRLSQHLGVPLVLEYNGSEVWIGENWGRPPRYRSLALRVEETLIASADLVVVVSRALGDELARRGAVNDRVLVNPNGVDVDRYSPAVDGSPVRARHHLDGKQVIGFIGTFGRWHGAEVLADAFGRLLARRGDLRRGTRLLMIGDGLTRPEVEARLARHGVRDLAALTGLVPQDQGPSHLAACDLLVSPHVRNADGSPFFGSPTKLFEYMAMGKGIVASDLDQIGEALDHGQTALLVDPGDADALACAMERLLDDPPLRRRLGAAARAAAVARHSWTEHTRRIIEALERRVSACGAA
jgi:glycosyltransferase involved in cell wall biosynthesis